MTLHDMINRTEGISIRNLNHVRMRAAQSYDVLALRDMVEKLSEAIVILKAKPAPFPQVSEPVNHTKEWEVVKGEDGHSYLRGRRVVTQK